MDVIVTIFNLIIVVIVLIGAVECIYTLFLAIKALKIYVKKNS